MKRFILISLLSFVVSFAFGQRFHFKNVYTTVDTLVLKNIASVSPTNNGDYLITLPIEDKLIIAYNNDHSKAIVLHGYAWGKRMEFNVKYDATRLILWYKDENLYCGYIYDIRLKACQYFEAINENEKDRLTKRFKFLERIPSFSNN